jgi:hypothetical protein
MEYKEFKNKHQGQKILVVGCGTSASTLTNQQDYITIGVNDLSRLFVPNYLVVLNDKSSFEADRWKWIESSTCPHIFTHIKALAINEEQKRVLQLGRYAAKNVELYKDSVDYTSNSTFVACVIAAYMGASKIGLLGVDFTLNHFFAESGEHTLAKKINVINQEYEMFKNVFCHEGREIVNLSEISRITSLPKQTIAEF